MSQEDLGLAQCFTRASLYVGDLHNDVTEAILFEKFSAIGAILSIRVCRDKVTRRSLSYAYINFQLPADAERAIQTMNFDVVQGRPIRIMWSQRDPSLRKSGVGNIFIKNLEKSIDNKEVFDTFSEFGKILSCKVAQDANGTSKGYGFVHYEKEESALKSIETVNGMLLKGKKVFVGKFIPRRERENSEPTPKPFTNVYIKNFGEDFNDELLRAMFEKYGEITSHKVMKTEDGKSRGFGFVAFKEPVEALRAIEGLNGIEVSSGKALYVGPAQSKAERQRELRRMIVNKVNPFKGMNVFVKNLELGVDDVQLRQEFSRIGDITSAKVMLEQGRSKGFGFVCFTSAADAENAIAKMNGMLINGKAVYVALAQSKAERQAYLTAHPTYSHVKAPIVQHRSQDYVAPQLSHLASWSSGESSQHQMPRFATAGSAWWGSAAAASNVYRYPQQAIRYAVSTGGTNYMEGRALRAAHHY